MAYRLQRLRLAIVSHALGSCAALLLSLVAGCQGGSQYDMAARELRMQEDELYAMEDYMNQYQELICKYRTENRQLRRQLREANGDAGARARRTTPRRGNGAPPATDGPSMDTPETPRPNGPTTPPVIEMPEVPPLESGALEGPEPENEIAELHDVRLRGEVIEKEAEGGPRLVVEVEPLDASRRVMEFDGTLSLMLLAPDGDRDQRSLARWDFPPEDIQAAVDRTSDEQSIRFHLELPADTPIVESTEIWVRLLPNGGAKLLAHAEIDLEQPGLFASNGASPDLQEAPGQGEVVTAVYEEAVELSAAPVESEVYDGGWSIARPGEPANLPQASAEGAAEWRPSLETPPEVVVVSAPARPKPRVSRPALQTMMAETPAAMAESLATETMAEASSATPEMFPAEDIAAATPVATVVKPPSWAPERPGNSAGHSRRTASALKRPRWSATR